MTLTHSAKSSGLFLLWIIIFNLIVYYYFSLVVSQTGGVYVYPLDDSYIHMELAVKFSESGTWGIEEGVFSSASSSPLFLIVNALMIKIFGNYSLLPLFAGILVSNLVLFSVYRYSKLFDINPVWMLIFLISPVLLHIQAISGMEHSWHILLVFLSTVIFSRIIDDKSSRNERFGFILLLSLLCLIRYESMFVITAFAFGFFIHGKFKWMSATLFFGFLPVLIVGLYFISNGGYFFPNTLLIKGNIGLQQDLLSKLYDYFIRIKSLFYQPNFALPIAICMISFSISIYKSVFIHQNSFISVLRDKVLMIVIFSIILMHTMFASFGWLFRYEAYLYIILYFVTCIEIKYLSNQFNSFNRIIYFSLIIGLVVFSFPRLSYSNEVMKLASKNIHDQPYQMSMFFKKYYNDSYVMINDIGTTAYFTDTRIIDVVGLASNEVLVNLLAGHGQDDSKFRTLFMRLWKDKCKIAFFSDVAHSTKVKGMGWEKVGEWIISNNVICASDRIHIYAADEDASNKLKNQLREFSNSLPEDVIIKIEE